MTAHEDHAHPRPVLRIKDWTVRYEVNRTRELKRMDWVPMPNSMDGDGYTELMNHRHGAAHLGAWLAIVQIASKCEPRGCLIRRCGAPHDPESLSRISRISAKVFAEAIPRLLEIKWLEEAGVKPIKTVKSGVDDKRVTPEIPQVPAAIPHPAAVIPQGGAVLARARGTERKGAEGSGGEVLTPPPINTGLDGFDFHGWFERQYARHPKKKDKGVAVRYAAESIFRSFQPDEFERVHALMCDSESWRWKNGAAAPSLAEWILDEGWKYPPPPESTAQKSALARAMEEL
jgi:hypothetical protein